MQTESRLNIFVKLGLTTSLLLRFAGAFGAEAPQYSMDVSLSDIMASIVMPAADALWNAVAIDVTAEGEIITAPQTEAEWGTLRNSAVTLAAATNLLLVPQLHIINANSEQPTGPGELSPAAIAELRNGNMQAWTAHVLLLHETALQALKAVDLRDTESLSNAGGELDAACESCHLQFWYPEG